MYVIRAPRQENGQQRNESAGGAKCGCPKISKCFSLLPFFSSWVCVSDLSRRHPSLPSPPSHTHTYTRIQSNFQLCFFSFFDSFSKKNPPLRPETISHFDLNRNITHKKHFPTTTEFSKNDDGQTILIPIIPNIFFPGKNKKRAGAIKLLPHF